MEDELHVDGASPSKKEDVITPEGVEKEKEGKEQKSDPFETALERLSKTGKKAKQIAEKANSGVEQLQRTMTTIAERLERMEAARAEKADGDNEDEDTITDADGQVYKKSEVEGFIKKVAPSLTGVSSKRMERIERLLEENEIDKRLSNEDISPSEKKLIREVLQSRIQRTDDLDEDIRVARSVALAMAAEHAEEGELRHAVGVAGAAGAGVTGRRTTRASLSNADREIVDALKQAFPDRKVDWEKKYLATRQ